MLLLKSQQWEKKTFPYAQRSLENHPKIIKELPSKDLHISRPINNSQYTVYIYNIIKIIYLYKDLSITLKFLSYLFPVAYLFARPTSAPGHLQAMSLGLLETPGPSLELVAGVPGPTGPGSPMVPISSQQWP